MLRLLSRAALWKNSTLVLTSAKELEINQLRHLSKIPEDDVHKRKHYTLLVVGGGTGGCTMAAKFVSKLGKWKVAVIEPTEMHYYQPIWTLVGAGIKKLEDSGRPMKQVLPKNADWIKDKVVKFDPEENKVVTHNGFQITYDYMIVALGLQLRFGDIKGLPEGLHSPGICSNYSPETVNQTFKVMRRCKYGNAIFTFPNTPVKCPGAPQKIMYLAEEYFRKQGCRDSINVQYCSSLDVIFGVKKYANELMKIVKARNIQLNFKQNLIEVKPDTKEAIFQKLGTDDQIVYEYEMLHITPPMGPPDVLKTSSLADKSGFLNVNKKTLQHIKYKNVFGIGDCTNLPTSRTAAAVAAESGILRENLQKVMEGKNLDAEYDGYTSCPLVTGRGRCILAEFDYDAQPLETFPVNQGKERWTMYSLKKDFMPQLYWHRMLKGKWEGPGLWRKLLHLGFSK